MRSKRRNILRNVIETLLPEICAICGENIKPRQFPSKLCGGCISELPFRGSSYAFMKLYDPGAIEKKDYLPLFITAYYDLNIRQMVNYLKFHRRKDFAISIGELMAISYAREKRNYQDEYRDYLEIDYVIPIPLHKKRLKERGYNQVELIAENFSKETGIKLLNNALIREKYTIRQSETLDRNHRLENVKDAFSWNSDVSIKNKRVLLIDDVVASGQTMWQAALVLRAEGAEVTLGAFGSNQKV